ncbi:MAG: helicase-related protein [Pseudomonadota bacterium]
MASVASSCEEVTNSTLSAKNVTAVLGPTNTGKTHLALQRMLAHQSGLIGLPLRLLAREVYDKIVSQTSPGDVALITGEERIKPANARYFVCTVEAMPKEIDVDFVAIDEVQLAADPERGHIFTNRLLHARGKQETLLLGAATMRPVISDLLPGCNHISRPRLSKLTYSGQKKITRLPRRSAIVAFSSGDVYEIAELIRRQRGGAAVVLGALSPRTRNAQVQLYQSGDVDFLIATDAIGMGLNLDVNHVAFAATRKYDGHLHRDLTLAEMGQIAGRAGRHTNDGTFGVTGSVEPFLPEMVSAMENHDYDPVKILQWRNANLDFSSLETLKASLNQAPNRQHMVRARMADDVTALENITKDSNIREMARSKAALKHLWDACQVPDYRKISAANHSELVANIFKFIISENSQIPEDWLAQQIAHADDTQGDIDTLANRISHIRTWTFISNRQDWLHDPQHWQCKTREIEDKLSDALHEKLTERFVDQRTSILMKRLRDTEDLFAEISDDGSLHVEKHYVGRLHGFRFFPDTASTANTLHGKAARSATAKVLSKELGMRVRRIVAAKSEAIQLNKKGYIQWRGEDIAFITAGDNPLQPNLTLLSDEHLAPTDKEKATQRLQNWLTEQIETRLQPLIAMRQADDINGLGKGVAFQLYENFGILKREKVAEDIRALDQDARAQLRKYGVRFGAFNIYVPILLKPAAVEFLLVLWTLKEGPHHNITPETAPEPPRAGLTSVLVDDKIPESYYLAAGYQRCGMRAVRIDMLERLADMIRPLTSWRTHKAEGEQPPKGTTGDGGFTTQPEMMSIMGCSGEELASVLTSLGFYMERKAVERAENNLLDSETTKQTDQESKSEENLTDENTEQAPLTSDTQTTTEQEASPENTPKNEEPLYEEVWRPKKRKSHQKTAKHSSNNNQKDKAHHKSRNDTNDATELKKKGSYTQNQSSDGKQNTAKRNEKQNKRNYSSKKQNSHKKSKKVECDPDSPFAALGALKKELEANTASK